MTTTTRDMSALSRAFDDFYVPAFEVYRGDQALPDSIVRDVIDLTYHDSIEDIDGFELTLNNWDADLGRFRYVGAPGSSTSPFEPGMKITVRMGYAGHLEQMLVGEITSLEPDFPESGSPTLRVSGLNELHGFRRQQHTWRFTDKTDSAIARWIGSRPQRRNAPGIDFPVETPHESREAPTPVVDMRNEHDIVFLLRRARVRGYTLKIQQNAAGQRALFFGLPDEAPAADLGTPQHQRHVLSWGTGLLSFKPELTTSQQVSEVTVLGFNRTTGRPIEGTATLARLRPRPNADQHDVARAISGRREVVHHPVTSRREARALARSILQHNARGLIVGNGETLGLPQLRAGESVVLDNLGDRFSGEYYLLETSHSIGGSGYRTRFKARRMNEAAT